jgi:gamma-glutamyltranspeptidase/glutathione hydrolase
MASFVAESLDRLAEFPATAKVFLHADGSPKGEGDTIVQPELATTMERIAVEGYEDFYHGEIAQAMVAHVQAEGGILTMDDLAAYPEKLLWIRTPDRVPFKDFTVEGATPSSSALLLHLLRLVDGLELSRYEALSSDKLHRLIEAMKLAFAERAIHIGDHTQVNVPLAGLLDGGYAGDRRKLIREDRVQFPQAGDPWAYQTEGPDLAKVTAGTAEDQGQGGCTTHHSHVDRWGNFVSLTQSLGDAFGSAVTIPGYGFLLNNALKLFDPRPGRKLAGIAPFKRPLSPWPTLLLKDEVPVMAIGSPSGTRIPNAITQVLVNVIEHGMGLQAAVNLPRVHWSGHELEAEKDLPEAAQRGLAARGHEVLYRNSWSPWFGAVQVVARDPISGLCNGAADPRRQGAVAGVNMMPP